MDMKKKRNTLCSGSLPDLSKMNLVVGAKQLKKAAIREAVAEAKQKVLAAKEEVKAARLALKNAKHPAEAVSKEETAVAVRAAKRSLDLAKQDLYVAKMGVERAKHPGEILKDNIVKRFWKTKFLFLLFLPALIYYIMFKYVPMWGVSISFYDYSIFKGMAGSKFIGFRHFEAFFASPDFWLVTRNTLALSLQGLFIAFPVTILFALLLNEIRSQRFKKITQTISYMPHFLSVVVVCALINTLTDPTTGAINSIIKALGFDPIYFMANSKYFRGVYLVSEIWQGVGWGSIVFLAAISGVDPGLYEAARLDGAGRWRQIWSITLPSIAPTVATMFILRVGHVMDGSLEKVLLLQKPITYEVSQTIATYTYNIGIAKSDYDISTAVGLYSSLINLMLLICANWVSKKVTETSVF